VDAVIVSRLFLIVSDKQEAMQQIFGVLRPGGRCFIAEPTSGFRTRIPLTCMWLLARLSSKPLTNYREPRQAEVLPRPEFRSLVGSQPWDRVRYWHDGWYQYAVCERT
jgi:arsenite methyltransferase